MKCVACGSKALIAGVVRENGGGAELRFYPSDQSLLKQLFLSSGTRVRSYGCLHCHNLQLAVDFNEGEFFGFNVDAGLGCVLDKETLKHFCAFQDKFHNENPGKNLYDDHFAVLFAANYAENPIYQREAGDWINWKIPGTDYHIPFFQSGFGDGTYPVYYGFDVEGNVCSLIIQFIDIELAYSDEE